MKLRVICQVCGKTGTIDTNKEVDDQGFSPHSAKEFSEKEQNWDIWLCDECEKGWEEEKLTVDEILYPKEISDFEVKR